uniref:hypothetical protein n=1 Tax=Legionella quateirensis TaxID=45072 RepID=UPI001A942B08
YALPGFKISSPIPSALEIKLSCLQFKDTSLGVDPKGRIPGFHLTSIAQTTRIKFQAQEIQPHNQSWFIFAEILRLAVLIACCP